MGDGLAGDADAGSINVGDSAGETVAGKAKAIRAEGVGFEDLGAGLEVLFVNGHDECRIGQVELVVTAMDEDAPGVEDGAHGAVCEQRLAGEDVTQLRHSEDMLTHREANRCAGEVRGVVVRARGLQGVDSVGFGSGLEQGCFVILRKSKGMQEVTVRQTESGWVQACYGVFIRRRRRYRAPGRGRGF